MLSLYRKLIALRRAEPALAVGSYGCLWAERNVLAYERRHADRTIGIALNFGSGSERVGRLAEPGRVLISTYPDRSGETVGAMVQLRPDEGVVIAEER